ncbi:MAG: DUF1648 domain-containing protein [Rhodococcus sp.]|jgi:hypothetical protein|uniref:DUF1648 domain-containing protein n=1 Tax=Nocardiaceae TaxID=85025 RepID=UPI00050BFA16|nr:MULTISPECIES: DUF1648 domain-containing protein [Rhodococcus]MBJ7349301.1 DUF1648 domain-containing protein [Rhodococcus sp. (in: high G+C Gram-positive bacteria)]KQU30011.1 beta-carotene 15,15'-monooxygenase [Rhodococcus sp. Leaf233]MBY3988441.1 DUF1648 domain-containing protein [Rhodococcus fascians]MBY3997983.1 DUF1648 domain-containing protein [Rhodococcus fascians]MBY4004343.1 DUF1648 domain-containing protein [Rhodococcus fascians]
MKQKSLRTFDPAGVVFGVVLPLAVAALCLVLAYLWEGRLPDQVATHFSGTQPDDFSNPLANAWTVAIVIVLVGGGVSAVAALARVLLIMRRTMLIIGLTVVGTIGVLEIATLARELDLPTEQSVTIPGWAIAVGTVAGFAIGLFGATRLRDHRERVVATAPLHTDLPRCGLELPLVVPVGASRVAAVTVIALSAAGAGVTCYLSNSPWPIFLFVPLTILILSLLRFTVHIDSDGLYVSSLGMAAFDYDIAEITGASVRTVNPAKDFGGWGLRAKGRGNYAVATEAGPAAFVTFANGDRLTIGTAAADTIAGTLNTLTDRARTTTAD